MVLGSVLLLFLFVCGWRFTDDLRFFDTHAEALKRDLGFDYRSPYFRIGGRLREVMTLEGIVPDGVLARAGIREGDIPLDESSIIGLFRMLESARGSNVAISVVPGGDGPPLEQRPKRKVEFFVPSHR
jgi:hypothetical protein